MLTAVPDPSSHGQRATTTSSRSALHWGAFWEGERCSYHQLGQQQEGANPPAGGSALSSAEHPQLLLLPRELQRQELDEPELLMGSQAEERGDGTWTTGTWHCSSLRDQHNLQRDQEIPHLSCCCCWDSSLAPHVELGLGLGFFSLCSFLPHLSPFLHPQEFRPSNNSLKHPPHHECHHFEMLPDATGASAQREKWPFKGKLLHLLGRVLLHSSFKSVP